MASLVVQTGFIGDVVLTTPLIAELATRGDVDVVTTPEGAPVLANNPSIRNVIVYDRRGADRGLAGFMRTVARVRHAGNYGSLESATPATGPSRGYDTAFLASGSHRSAALVLMAGIPRRIGFTKSEGRRFYTSQVQYITEMHHAERCWRLSMSECCDAPTSEQIKPRLYPSPDDVRAVEALLARGGLDTSKPFIAFAPGSVWGTKRWPFYPELAVHLAPRFNIAVVGGSGDAQLGETILAQLPPGSAVNGADRLGVLASAALIGKAAAMVTNDSAPLHLASAMGTPTISVFGPTVPELGYGPLAPGSSVAELDGLSCRPCHHHGPQMCPLGHWRCMREVSSSEVLELVTQTIS